MQPDSMGRVIIPLSKRKIILVVLGAIGFVAISFFLWSISDIQSRFNPLIVKGVAILGIGFFGLCVVYGILKLFDTKPGLVLDNDGIIDNSSGVSAGHVPWSEIVGIDITSVLSQKFLTFLVIDPDKYVERGSFLKRKINTINLKYYGSPIQISSKTLRIDFQELTELVSKYYDQYKAKA